MVGKRIKQLREEKGLTQEELAKIVHLSQQSIDHYEKGRAKPSLETIQLMADYFNVSLDYIAGRDKKKLLDLPLAAHYESQLPIADDDELLETIERMLERRRQKKAAKEKNK